MAYADYDFYINKYYGDQIDSDDFQKFAERASDYVYGFTQGLSDNVTKLKTREQVQKATCAIAELLHDEYKISSKAFSSEAIISSETVGSHSVSYGNANISQEEVDYLNGKKLDALRLYLGNLPEFARLFRTRSYPCTHRTQ